MMIMIKCNDGKEHTRVEDEDAGETVCSKCGVVLDERIISTVAPKIDMGDWSKLTGHAPQIGTSTIIPLDNKLSGKNRASADTLRKWDSRIRTRANPTTKIMIDTIASVGDKLSLPKHIIIEINNLAVNVTKQKMTRGRAYNETIAGCIIAVCRKQGIVKSMSDVADALNTSSKRVFRIYRKIKDQFEMDAKVQSPSDYIPQIASKLDLPEKVSIYAQKYLKKIMDLEFHIGRNPVVVATTILYLSIKAHEINITQRNIANVADITDISIRNTQTAFRKLCPDVFTSMFNNR